MEPLYCRHSSDSFMIKGGFLVVFLYIAETMHSVLIGGGILIIILGFHFISYCNNY